MARLWVYSYKLWCGHSPQHRYHCSSNLLSMKHHWNGVGGENPSAIHQHCAMYMCLTFLFEIFPDLPGLEPGHAISNISADIAEGVRASGEKVAPGDGAGSKLGLAKPHGPKHISGYMQQWVLLDMFTVHGWELWIQTNLLQELATMLFFWYALSTSFRGMRNRNRHSLKLEGLLPCYACSLQKIIFPLPLGNKHSKVEIVREPLRFFSFIIQEAGAIRISFLCGDA